MGERTGEAYFAVRHVSPALAHEVLQKVRSFVVGVRFGGVLLAQAFVFTHMDRDEVRGRAEAAIRTPDGVVGGRTTEFPQHLRHHDRGKAVAAR